MGIDALTFRFTIIKKFEIKYINNRLSQLIPSRANEFNRFFVDAKAKFGNLIYSKDINGLNPGIQAIFMYRNKQFPSTFYLCISINPAAILHHKMTPDLYHPNNETNRILQDAYAEIIIHLFPEIINNKVDINTDGLSGGLGSIPYLGLGTLTHAEFSFNFLLTDYKEETMKLIKRSALSYTQNQLKYANNNTYFKNNSSSDMIYDKYEKCVNKYKPSEDYLSLSRDICRFEHTQKNNISNFIAKNFIPIFKPDIKVKERYMGALAVLDGNITSDIAKKQFIKLVGSSDWYDIDTIINVINNSDFQQRKKSELIHFSESLLNQNISIQDLYIKAKSAGTNKLKQFKTILKCFKKLNIQPVPIPSSIRIQRLDNPLKLIVMNNSEEYHMPRLNLPPKIKSIYEKNVNILFAEDKRQKDMNYEEIKPINIDTTKELEKGTYSRKGPEQNHYSTEKLSLKDVDNTNASLAPYKSENTTFFVVSKPKAYLFMIRHQIIQHLGNISIFDATTKHSINLSCNMIHNYHTLIPP